MTEGEWTCCSNVGPMLAFLQNDAAVSERKGRLFAVACCRRFWTLLKDERGRYAVEAAERYADGGTTRAALERARQAVQAVRHRLTSADQMDRGAWAAYWITEVAASEKAFAEIGRQRWALHGILELASDPGPTEPELLRDIFRPRPLRPVKVCPTWLTSNDGTIPKMARAIYDERAYDRMPILADALEEAGCQDIDMLDHCRQPAQHVRGCWLVDALLEKE